MSQVWRLLGDVDIHALCEAVLAAPDSWWWEDQTRQHGTGVAKESQSIRLPDSHSLSWQRWSAVVHPVLENIKDRWYPTSRYGKIVLSRLLPHTRIALHVDREPDQDTLHRVHVPVTTNDAALVVFTQPVLTRCHCVPGHAYEIASERPHLAFNQGQTPRVHLVADYHHADQ